SPAIVEELLETEPVFREHLRQCAETLARCGRPGLVEGLLRNAVAYDSVSAFAFEYALGRLWQSRGVEPVAVIGHQGGEYVAGCLNGALSLPAACQILVGQFNGTPLESNPSTQVISELAASRAGSIPVVSTALGDVVDDWAGDSVKARVQSAAHLR